MSVFESVCIYLQDCCVVIHLPNINLNAFIYQIPAKCLGYSTGKNSLALVELMF